MCATLFSGFFYLLSSPSPAVLSLTCPLPLKLITENFILIVLFFHLWIPVNTTRPTLLPTTTAPVSLTHTHYLLLFEPIQLPPPRQQRTRTPRNTKISTNVFTFSLPVPVPVPVPSKRIQSLPRGHGQH